MSRGRCYVPVDLIFLCLLSRLFLLQAIRNLWKSNGPLFLIYLSLDSLILRLGAESRNASVRVIGLKSMADGEDRSPTDVYYFYICPVTVWPHLMGLFSSKIVVFNIIILKKKKKTTDLKCWSTDSTFRVPSVQDGDDLSGHLSVGRTSLNPIRRRPRFCPHHFLPFSWSNVTSNPQNFQLFPSSLSLYFFFLIFSRNTVNFEPLGLGVQTTTPNCVPHANRNKRIGGKQKQLVTNTASESTTTGRYNKVISKADKTKSSFWSKEELKWRVSIRWVWNIGKRRRQVIDQDITKDFKRRLRVSFCFVWSVPRTILSRQK